MTVGGFDSPLAPLSSQTWGFVLVCFEWSDFMWKWREVNESECFRDTLRNHLPELYCVLMHTERVCVFCYVGVLMCRSMYESRSSRGLVVAIQRGLREFFCFFLTTSAEFFNENIW